ncbi:MAG: CpaF family protein [Oligoflexia bacterium]|nr:CpaF family protein [Oligoflexia bacterium]
MKNVFGALQEIYNNPAVSEIIVDKFNDVYWEESGKIVESDKLFSSSDEIIEVIEGILKSVGRKVKNIENGFADLRLEDGSRVAITLPPISINGPTILIRKLPHHNVSFDDMLKWNVATQEGIDICKKIMATDQNVLLAGNAGSGKTTMANLLIEAIDPAWRVVTVEKVAELNVNGRKRTHQLETPNAKAEELQELVKKASYLRADTLVINELHGSEAFEATKLMREGYGVMATISAESSSDALKKCEMFCLMGQFGLGINEIKYHVSSAVNYVIFQERLPHDGSRKITHIAKVEGVNEAGKYQLTSLYFYDRDADKFVLTNDGQKFIES